MKHIARLLLFVIAVVVCGTLGYTVSSVFGLLQWPVFIRLMRWPVFIIVCLILGSKTIYNLKKGCHISTATLEKLWLVS